MNAEVSIGTERQDGPAKSKDSSSKSGKPSHNSTPPANRQRVVSLDRGQENMAVNTSKDDDDNSTVTSDGESSYFQKNMPSPKSGRLSFTSDTGSISSAPARAVAYRESDASLSFSDDEDEENDHLPTQASLLPPSVSREELQFKGITRIHSVSSLVSEEEQRATGETSETDLQHNAQRLSSSGNDRPRDNFSFFPTYPPNFSAPQPLHASPPPIASHQMQYGGFATYPRSLSGEQMQSWRADGIKSPMVREDNNSQSLKSTESKGSHGTLNFAYSEDEETEEGNQGVIAFLSGGGGADPSRGGVFRGADSSSNGLNGNDDNGPEGDVPQQQQSSGSGGAISGGKIMAAHNNDDNNPLTSKEAEEVRPSGDFKVYWHRWIMLFYMSLLNLLSDWTCYSVAPIATLSQEAFGSIDPEQLVTIFLAANAVASACEPIILSRLGLRRTVIFGALLLMIGSIVKSGGLPPLFQLDLEKGQGEWRVYLGFFLVGLSQPLYQCTPALLSASWFPEKERTMATGVALNANQLGIGFAFVFGSILVGNSDDIVPYFGLLSLISTLAFLGSLFQFEDAPPTPPSDTARVIRGTMEWNLPDTATNILQSVRQLGRKGKPKEVETNSSRDTSRKISKKTSPLLSSSKASTRRRTHANRSHATQEDAPFRVSKASLNAPTTSRTGPRNILLEPSPMMPGPVNTQGQDDRDPFDDMEYMESSEVQGIPHAAGYPGAPPYISYPMPTGQPYPPPPPPQQMGQFRQQQYWIPPQQFHQYPSYQHGGPYQGYGIPQEGYGIPQEGYGIPQEGFTQYQHNPYHYAAHPYPPQYPPPYMPYDQPQALHAFPPTYIEEYAEPTLTITDHHLDINIRDDQVLLSIRACFARRGFVHALVTFTVSGIVINTLSTYMDYLVRLNGAGREYVGIVGGSFQFVIMISSLIIGKQTDNSRAYYSVTIAMLVFGAFALAECGVSLDADRGGDLRWALIVVAALVGPLQPVSTELGVEVAYPLSENTVLVIQQLFSNLLSALFIPLFKALRDVGTERFDSSELYERPQYTFSFYLLIVLHAAVTVFFATFDGRYLRYEHELAKKQREAPAPTKTAEDEQQMQFEQWKNQYGNSTEEGDYPNERQPLVTGSQS